MQKDNPIKLLLQKYTNIFGKQTKCNDLFCLFLKLLFESLFSLTYWCYTYLICRFQLSLCKVRAARYSVEIRISGGSCYKDAVFCMFRASVYFLITIFRLTVLPPAVIFTMYTPAGRFATLTALVFVALSAMALDMP